MNIAELRKQLTKLFSKHQTESPEYTSGLLVMHLLGCSKSDLLRGEASVPDAVAETAFSYAKRRIDGEPLAYILGSQPFMDLDFCVSPSVLIPRPDTELLAEVALDFIREQTRPLTLWDLGCGSGCICISLCHAVDTLTAVGMDISDDALAVAGKNAARCGVDSRIRFLRHDMLTGAPPLPPPDIIVSNPPYIRSDVIPTLQPEVQTFEPRIALDGGKDGLDFYRKIIHDIPPASGGLMALEIGYDQGDAVTNLMQEGGYKSVTLRKDYGGNPRVVWGIRL